MCCGRARPGGEVSKREVRSVIGDRRWWKVRVWLRATNYWKDNYKYVILLLSFTDIKNPTCNHAYRLQLRWLDNRSFLQTFPLADFGPWFHSLYGPERSPWHAWDGYGLPFLLYEHDRSLSGWSSIASMLGLVTVTQFAPPNVVGKFDHIYGRRWKVVSCWLGNMGPGGFDWYYCGTSALSGPVTLPGLWGPGHVDELSGPLRPGDFLPGLGGLAMSMLFLLRSCRYVESVDLLHWRCHWEMNFTTYPRRRQSSPAG